MSVYNSAGNSELIRTELKQLSMGATVKIHNTHSSDNSIYIITGWRKEVPDDTADDGVGGTFRIFFTTNAVQPTVDAFGSAGNATLLMDELQQLAPGAYVECYDTENSAELSITDITKRLSDPDDGVGGTLLLCVEEEIQL